MADQYDRYRPVYPPALIEDLVELRPARVLDVGCGTGKVAVALAERGLSVLGVEVDERMAEVARKHGIDVHVADFESYDAGGPTFDLLTCGDAWHWIDPARGAAKAAEVVKAGGTVARFWTVSDLDEEMIAAFDPIYRELAPEITRPSQMSPRFHASRADPFGDAFSATELRTYGWERSLLVDEWLGLAATISDHQRLGPDRLRTLLDLLRAAIVDLGGTVHSRNETYALLNRRD